MTYADATETADGLESATDKQTVDKLDLTTPSTISATPAAQSGSFSSASYNVTYIELPDRLIWLAGRISVTSVGSASGTITVPLPVAIASVSNGTASINVGGYDYATNQGLDVASISYTQLRVQSGSGTGNAFVSGSNIAFQCVYQGSS